MRIAIIEDDKGLNNGIVLALKQEEYRFYQYSALKEANNIEDMDLVILDINLPDGNGFDFLRELRTHSDVPVIILTANDLETDEVMGLNLGADDYMTKPFSLMVLRARIEKLLNKKKVVQKLWQFGNLELDFEHMRFLKAGICVELSKTEQRLLRLLVENHHITMKRETLLNAAAGCETGTARVPFRPPDNSPSRQHLTRRFLLCFCPVFMPLYGYHKMQPLPICLKAVWL